MFPKNVLFLKNAGNALIILKNSERHHSISKSYHSSTCSRFKGIFFHLYDILSGKFLHEICSTQQLESLNSDICGQSYPQNKKTAQIWKFVTLEIFGMLTTREWFTTRDRKQGWWLVQLWRVVTEGKVDDSWTPWRLVNISNFLPLAWEASIFILASPKLVPSTYQS